MRKARRVTRADFAAAGRGLARDVSTGLAAIERRKLALDADKSTEPEYPGATIRQQLLTRDGEPGDVRVMDYGSRLKARYRVAAFCPGYETNYPGDTPKMNPNRQEWCKSLTEANSFYDIYVTNAKLWGWQPMSPTGRLFPTEGTKTAADLKFMAPRKGETQHDRDLRGEVGRNA